MSSSGGSESGTGSNSAVEGGAGGGQGDPADQVSTVQDDQRKQESDSGDVDRDALGNEDGAS